MKKNPKIIFPDALWIAKHRSSMVNKLWNLKGMVKIPDILKM